MPDSKKLILIDAYSLIYRAYYAFIKNPRINSKGLNTSAIFGFVNSLLDVINKENPTHIAVAFDPPGPTFRHDFFAEYKANRDATPEDILKAVPHIKEIIDALNIQRIEEYGFEADDVIGTLANKAEKEGFEVIMYTPDKDYCQLVTEKVYMLKPGRSGNDAELVTPKEVCENFNIDDPKKVIDVLGLWGDSSDNIPGAPGIGEKGAKKLINEYGSIEGVYNNIDQLKGKLQENLVNFKDQVELSKRLATIKLDVPVEVKFDEFALNEPDTDELAKIFGELEFRTLLDRINKKSTSFSEEKKPQKSPDVFQGSLFDIAGQTVQTPENSQYKTIKDISRNYHFVDSLEKAVGLIDKLSQLEELCFDTETTGLDVYTAELVGLSFCFKTNEAYYVPVPTDKVKAKELLNLFKTVFERNNILKIGQNIKFDAQILRNYSIEVKGKWFDTMLAHYLLQPEQRHNLGFLSEKYLEYSPIPIEALIGKKGKNQLTMRSVSAEKITDYACEDADLTFQLKQILKKELEDEILLDLFEKLEMPLVRVLIDIEEAGFNLDTDALNKYGEELRIELIKIEDEILQLAGVDFNILSPKQLGEVLFEKLKIDSTTKTSKTKQYSTSEEILLKLLDKHPIIEKILEFRSLKKLLSTYVEALPKLIHPKTNKIHTSFNQAVTATGRLSSNNPNLQNIPIREERGREIRKSFIPSDNNHVLLAADYSQIELRLMAHMSRDENMLEAFNNNEDIHTTTAAKINKIQISEVTKDMRSSAKTANFGIIYGISSFGLSQRLQISRSDAKSLIDGYFDVYPKVKTYMDDSIYKAREKGYVLTLMGRKRVLSDINSRNATVRGFAERNAINAPIQGSAADIIKVAMINIHKKLVEENYKTKMILQVHDELIFDVPREEIEKVKIMVKTEMENVMKLKIPLIVDIGIGNNWLEAH